MQTLPVVENESISSHGISSPHPRHPLKTRARVLLTSVFGPYAQDDAFGSRAINPMELYHNQVTREQGAFSLRMFHRSWGLMMIRHNISAPATLLDFPSLALFENELQAHCYDVVGISSIIPNVGKVRAMCQSVRRLSPHSKIVIGGHVAAIPGLESMIDADHIVRGEGIAWMRRYLGEDDAAPIRHPHIVSGFGTRIMGVSGGETPGGTAATVIPSVGCPLGCDFCTTSAFFGGKGKSVDFYSTGEELFRVLTELESSMGVRSFFIMDENFLLRRQRAMQLLELIRGANKSWSFYVFSSANALAKYRLEELVALGISWVWIGLESPHSQYAKLQGADTRELVRGMHQHGIKVLGSSIVGLPHHTPANIDDEIEYAASHETDFHQFMLFTPVPGTPLYAQMKQEDRLLESTDLADIHGQFQFNFVHPAISAEQSNQFLRQAFVRDFERNGPSFLRICATMLQGWRGHKNDPDPRIRERYRWETRHLRTTYSALLWAMEKQLRNRMPAISRRVRSLRLQLAREFGWSKSWLIGVALGPFLLWALRREERRLANQQTFEPPSFIERTNWPAN